MRQKDNLKHLFDRRDRLRVELEGTRARLDEVESLIRIMGGEAPLDPEASDKKPRRGDLKEVVLGLYEEAGERGLSSAACVTFARERKGIDLQPASVSSLLSRLKADDVLFYDGDRYRLKRYAGPRASTGKGAV